jgi:Mrp family chromosome partitioning ATPase
VIMTPSSPTPAASGSDLRESRESSDAACGATPPAAGSRVLVTPAPAAPLETSAAPSSDSIPASAPSLVTDTPADATARPAPPEPTFAQPPTSNGLAPIQASASPSALLAVAADGARLVATPAPDRTTADGYLRMTARILLESQRQVSRSIGVVSAHEGEGRTAAAVNLAVCLGRAKGRRGRVLLVDGDARHRTLSRLFCGAESISVSGSAPAQHPMLIGTALDGVDLMTAPVLDDGLTVSSPDAWVKTFQDLGAMYPHIVVDCPAVLESPEALVLRECVQQLVLVVRAGSSSRSVVQRTLGAVSGHVIGVIMNGTAGQAGSGGWR